MSIKRKLRNLKPLRLAKISLARRYNRKGIFIGPFSAEVLAEKGIEAQAGKFTKDPKALIALSRESSKHKRGFEKVGRKSKLVLERLDLTDEGLRQLEEKKLTGKNNPGMQRRKSDYEREMAGLRSRAEFASGVSMIGEKVMGVRSRALRLAARRLSKKN